VAQVPVQALLFDMGGVVVDINFDLAFRYWQRFTSLSFDELRECFTMDTAYERHERGEVGAVEYFQHLRTTLKLVASDVEIAHGWNAIFIQEIEATVNAVQAAGQHRPCYAFTNSNPTHQVYWTAAYPRMVASFNRMFVSSELGLRKPERAAFEAIADATGISLSGMLFFDDTLENVTGARQAGLQAIHVQSADDVIGALVNLD
jgi:putative hydrolase of the HAD superfamily